MNPVKTLLSGMALSVALATSAIAGGVDVNASNTGLALQGYDPVAYFTDGAPTKGNYKITAAHDGATYRFASEEHKAAFEADPEAYLPQYGGFCAFGTAMGIKVDGDPHVWRIVDDELFLNISKDVQEKWVSDIPGYVEKADTNWDDIADKAPSALQN